MIMTAAAHYDADPTPAVRTTVIDCSAAGDWPRNQPGTVRTLRVARTVATLVDSDEDFDFEHLPVHA